VAEHPGILQKIAADNLGESDQPQGMHSETDTSDPEDSPSCSVQGEGPAPTETTTEKLARSATSLMNAVASDMFRGFDHFAVIELGALFETFLGQIDCELDESGLAESIRRNCDYGMLSSALKRRLVLANRTRNRIVHRRPGRFPSPTEIDDAKQAFAAGIVDLYGRQGRSAGLLESLAHSNPEVLNVLDEFFGLDG
jgi:hypothetical protein